MAENVLVPTRYVTAMKLRMDSPFSLREKVRMRGSNKAFFLIFILLTPTLSSRRGCFFLNLMAVTRYVVAIKLRITRNRWFPSWRDCESIIKKRVKALFTTKARSTRRKIIAFIQCIENFVLFVPSW